MMYPVLILMLIGCDTEKSWQLNDVTGHLPDLRFSLISDSGQAVTEQNYRGYQVLMFFGFTDCRSECPVTLFRLVNVMKRLGKDADHTRIVLVTLAPERDSPPVLHHYVTAFDAYHAIGLTGGSDQIEALAKRYRAAYRPGAPATESIVHSAAVYIFDAQGHARLLMTPDDAIDAVANDLRQLSSSGP